MRPTLVVLACAAALSACGPTVSIERAPDARIAAGSRWAWSAPDADGLSRREGGVVPDDSTARMIRDVIEAQLVEKGFPRTTPDSAQFVVHFHVGQRSLTDTLPPRDETPANVRTPGTWGGYGSPEELQDRVVTWEEGLLVIDAVTPDRGVVAWRGLISGEVSRRAEVEPRTALRLAVRRLLRSFP